MNRQEFIRGLEQALRGMKVPEARIREHVNYYENYFSSEEAGGRSETRIAEELGDPHLIARSIAEAEQFADSQAEEEEKSPGIKSVQVRSRLGCLAAGLVVFAVISLIFAIVGGIFSLIAPVLVPVLILVLLVRLFSKKQ